MKKSKKKTMKNIQKKRAKRNQRGRSHSGGTPRLVWSEGNEEFYEFDDNGSSQPSIFSGMRIKELDDMIDEDAEDEGAEPGDFQVDLFF